MKLCVAVPTFRRPELLAAALPVILRHLDDAQSKNSRMEASLLVIDNCPDRSAAATVGAVSDPRVRYVHEPVPGISAARNRALDENLETDLLSFIDDDESPTEQWLEPLLTTWEQTRAGAVMGRVESAFQAIPEPWVQAGKFFERSRMATGTPIKIAATGNLLLDLSQIRRSGVRFSEHLGLTGGEDSLFSRELVRANVPIVWCDESVAIDFVPAERLQRKWVLKRSWSHGNAATLVGLHLASSKSARAWVRVRAILRGAARVVGGFVRHLSGRITRSLHHQARGLRTMYRGAGMLAGGLGHVYVEYARTDDSPTPGNK